MTEASEISLAI